MQIAALTWDSNNIGDDVQTVAVKQHLPPVDLYIRREDLRTYDGPECLLVMNGWFTPDEKNWPPSDRIKPIFFGFHVEDRARPTIARHLDYLRKHKPIGCRDRGTMNLMKSLGVDAYLSLCATLTFEPSSDRVAKNLFLVDAGMGGIRSDIRDRHGLKSRTASHSFVNVRTETRMRYAEELLDVYRQTAGMVVTSRIHCAMPCVAMGIPVVFIGRKTSRTEIIEEIGLPLHDHNSLSWRLGLAKIAEWPKALDIAVIKERIRGDLRTRIGKAL